MRQKVYTNAYAWETFGVRGKKKKIGVRMVRCAHYLSSPAEATTHPSIVSQVTINMYPINVTIYPTEF